MYALKPIPRIGREVRDLCSPGITDEARRQRIRVDEPAITDEETRFRSAVETGTGRTLSPAPFSTTVQADMNWYYKHRLIASTPGKKIVSEILGLSKGRCAFCHIAKATTLDHSFPKSRYPRLAVDPLNLVPACRDCNLGRNVGHGTVTISPYFDHWVEDVPWLEASVEDAERPEDLVFRPTRHSSFTDDRWEALNEFFEETDLNARYADLAIDEFLPLAAEFRRNYDTLLLHEIVEVLTERVATKQETLGPNRWQTAAFAAWLNSASSIDWRTAGFS